VPNLNEICSKTAEMKGEILRQAVLSQFLTVDYFCERVSKVCNSSKMEEAFDLKSEVQRILKGKPKDTLKNDFTSQIYRFMNKASK